MSLGQGLFKWPRRCLLLLYDRICEGDGRSHEGGVHHTAATVEAKGVVIFGGFIPPEITGYDFHTNLFTGGEACGSRYSCKHCKAAMEAIEVDEVVEHMRKIINV